MSSESDDVSEKEKSIPKWEQKKRLKNDAKHKRTIKVPFKNQYEIDDTNNWVSAKPKNPTVFIPQKTEKNTNFIEKKRVLDRLEKQLEECRREVETLQKESKKNKTSLAEKEMKIKELVDWIENSEKESSKKTWYQRLFKRGGTKKRYK
jgi:hypothetical protein